MCDLKVWISGALPGEQVSLKCFKDDGHEDRHEASAFGIVVIWPNRNEFPDA